MYSLGDQIFRNKRWSARRNRNAERMQYISYLTQDTRYLTTEEAVAEFLHTLAHNARNKTNIFRLGRSGETISHHFHRVLIAIAQLATDIIKQAGINTKGIPYFEDCVGAIDGTHVLVHVPLATQGPFRNRKGTLSQNVMAACGFDLNFQYVHPSWEGSATDARVLQSSLAHADPLHVPAGKFYLVDAGYANAPGFLALDRGVRYRLNMAQRKNVCFNVSMDEELLALLQEQIELGKRKKSWLQIGCGIELLNASGFGFDVTTKRIIAEDDVWTAWLQGHPDAVSWRGKTIDYDKLSLVFGKEVATGQFASPSTYVRSPNPTASVGGANTQGSGSIPVGLND